MRRDIPVSRVMTRLPVIVTPDTTIDKIHSLFEKYEFHHLPVLNQGKLEGIISRSDYLKVQHVLSYSWSGKPGMRDGYNNIYASDIMSNAPLHIEPEDSIGLAADIFLANKIHSLPVIDDGELVGIVTSHDLLMYAYE